MKRMNRLALGLALLAGPALLAPSALAKNDHHKGTPPGLAKKPHGMPPGQAKKMWRRGEALPATYWRQSTYYIQPQTYRLRVPPPGYRWVLVDGDAYLVRSESGMIADIVAGLLR